MKTFLLSLLSCFYVCSVGAADPDLGRLQKSYDEAKKRVMAPLQATYQAELQKLLEQHTKAGKLEAAVEVKAELERLAEERSQPVSVAEQSIESALRKKLIKGRFIFYFSPPRSKLMTFSGNGKIEKRCQKKDARHSVHPTHIKTLIYNASARSLRIRFRRAAAAKGCRFPCPVVSSSPFNSHFKPQAWPFLSAAPNAMLNYPSDPAPLRT